MIDTNFQSYKEQLSELRSNLGKMLSKESLEIFDRDAEQLQNSFIDILKIKAGQDAPDFTLSNASGESINLYRTLKTNRVLLVFYRGAWCPYCNLALSHYQTAITHLTKLNTKLIAVSPQTPDNSLSIKEKNNLEFEVLSDNGNLVAELYTKVFKNGEAPLKEMEKLGIDFDSFYGNDTKEIPVPATFIIEQDRTISFAKAEGGDYRNRTDANEIIEALKK